LTFVKFPGERRAASGERRAALAMNDSMRLGLPINVSLVLRSSAGDNPDAADFSLWLAQLRINAIGMSVQ
jgi:hypothetical protein